MPSAAGALLLRRIPTESWARKAREDPHPQPETMPRRRRDAGRLNKPATEHSRIVRFPSDRSPAQQVGPREASADARSTQLVRGGRGVCRVARSQFRKKQSFCWMFVRDLYLIVDQPHRVHLSSRTPPSQNQTSGLFSGVVFSALERSRITSIVKSRISCKGFSITRTHSR